MHKYIFVTGGVVSGIGKGITAASIGLFLKSAGKSVDVIKCDPYLNIDPGTMSPFEHGEVYVLEDGAETDLDLGHYERFLDVNLTGLSSVTAGKIYHSILEKERAGEYLGRNVQLIPGVTDHIMEQFTHEHTMEIRIIEIGGSSGDMEGEIFLESFRQFKRRLPADVLHVHLGYVPFLACSGEYKTKPMQTSIRELLRMGLQPDLIVVRSEASEVRPLEDGQLQKIALFSNLELHQVISLPDQKSIYEVPNYLLTTELTRNLSEFLGEDVNVKLPLFYQDFKKNHSTKITIGLITKYTKLEDSYLSVIEALKAAAVSKKVGIKVVLLDSEAGDLITQISELDGVVVPGGFGKRGLEGKINAIQYVREHKIPFLGICLGMQMAVVEYARNVAGLNAHTREMFDEDEVAEGKMVIDFMPGQNYRKAKGGTMRLGDYECRLEKGSMASKLYGGLKIIERHRHRLEVQNQCVSKLEEKGLKVSGKFDYQNSEGSEDYLVEVVELDREVHPYFIATQAHPELKSRPNKPHPLFVGLIQSSITFHTK
jgi:CTP synthase